MPFIASHQAKPEYDVIIVGSGAGGGQTAYTLTLAGLKCVMLEAGRSYVPETETAGVAITFIELPSLASSIVPLSLAETADEVVSELGSSSVPPVALVGPA